MKPMKLIYVMTYYFSKKCLIAQINTNSSSPFQDNFFPCHLPLALVTFLSNLAIQLHTDEKNICFYPGFFGHHSIFLSEGVLRTNSIVSNSLFGRFFHRHRRLESNIDIYWRARWICQRRHECNKRQPCRSLPEWKSRTELFLLPAHSYQSFCSCFRKKFFRQWI